MDEYCPFLLVFSRFKCIKKRMLEKKEADAHAHASSWF